MFGGSRGGAQPPEAQFCANALPRGSPAASADRRTGRGRAGTGDLADGGRLLLTQGTPTILTPLSSTGAPDGSN